MRETSRVKRIDINSQDQAQGGLSKVKTVNQEMKIRYTEQVETDSHLYKLLESPVKKYIGIGNPKTKDGDIYPENNPELFLDMEHVHIFRTIDTDGRKHTKSVTIGGHYHVLELEFDKNDPSKAPKIVAMSGPMHAVSKKVKGRNVMADEPINHFDFHIHDVEYIMSQRIHARSSNNKAVEFLSKEANKVPAQPSEIAQAGPRT